MLKKMLIILLWNQSKCCATKELAPGSGWLHRAARPVWRGFARFDVMNRSTDWRSMTLVLEMWISQLPEHLKNCALAR
ncbi:hypothetical protein [Burkholderia sp. A9]|uniref:hypothetical protein n=1 Tax=Burkholderia sp. A9 TaxID=1365108 RepID=UPI0012699FB0|nr:hypothetical protein [Burkholderia sp. A9]